MLIWILELLFIIVIMKFFEEIGFGNSCIAFAIISVICSLFTSPSLIGIIGAFINGLIMGAVAYIAAKIFLIIIDILGAIGSFLIGLFIILLLLCIIF